MRKKDNKKQATDYKSQIKMLRESLGMTQTQLAEKVDRTSRAIRQIENGEAFPRISTLRKIADALDADLTISLASRTHTAEPEVWFPSDSNDFRIGEND